MPEDTFKLTAEQAADIQARVKSLTIKTIEKLTKAKDKNGTFDVIISTEAIDRSGEIVKQDGWELERYKNNPIVLWGHDYYSLPIGYTTDTYKTEKDGVQALGARGVFLSADINPLAQQVRKLYDLGLKEGRGVGCTTSVGFIPKEFDENQRNTITKAELLEFSFVPIPANQDVGAARGRALTLEEAKELQLDVAVMKIKGLQFAETKDVNDEHPADAEEEANKKDASVGDTCEVDDGTPGVFTSDPKDPDGALVCMPSEQDKSFSEEPQKNLLKAISDEHARHTDEVDKAVDDFREKAVIEDQNDPEDAGKKTAIIAQNKSVMADSVKDLRASISDEHTMHRANTVKCFRSFDPSEKKEFDKNEHLKALRGEHDAYEAKCMKAIDEFEQKCTKSIEAGSKDDEHTDWVAGKMEDAARVHKKAVTKIAKAMCKAAFGEIDEADEKTLAILKELLAPHVNAQILPAIAFQIGSKLASERKTQLGEAYEHLKAATGVLEALYKGFADPSEEESRSTGVQTPTDEGSRKQRSKPRSPSRDNNALQAHMLGREILRGIESVAREGLGKLNAEIRDHSKK
jgi:phage head maturation protease